MTSEKKAIVSLLSHQILTAKPKYDDRAKWNPLVLRPVAILVVNSPAKRDLLLNPVHKLSDPEKLSYSF